MFLFFTITWPASLTFAAWQVWRPQPVALTQPQLRPHQLVAGVAGVDHKGTSQDGLVETPPVEWDAGVTAADVANGGGRSTAAWHPPVVGGLPIPAHP